MKQRKVLVTGATGFVGSSVVSRLLCNSSMHVLAGARKRSLDLPHGAELFYLDDLSSDDYLESLQGVSAIVHCAARVHVMNEQSQDPLNEFRKVNVEGTLNLARQAAAAGVQRFVFISSIKVNGESTDNRGPFSADEVPQPLDPYGISKLEAEQALLKLASDSSMAVTIIRPVLVYGPGVKANFQSLMNWLLKRIPLPLGMIRNKRSMVSVDNLVDLIELCVDHPEAENEIFLVSDGEDLSTPELLRRTANALQVKVFLLPIPSFILRAIAVVIGRQGMVERLCGSLEVDITKTKSVLGWVPPVSVDQALAKTARHFLESLKK